MSIDTVQEAFDAALRGDPARPLITWKGAHDARSELSVRTTENNVAKAANLLQDDAEVAVGSLVTFHLPPHWQTVVWLAACAITGAVAWFDGDDAGADVVLSLVAAAHAGAVAAPLALAVSSHPFGLPVTTALPAGVLDAATQVRVHGDSFRSWAPPGPDDAWVRGADLARTHREVLDGARDLARSLGLADRARVLVPTAAPLAGPWFVDVLALPLVTGGSVVLLTDESALAGDLDALGAVAEQERCDAVVVLDR